MIGILAATGFPAQAQGIADFPFFRNVWQNVGPQAFPEGMRNPAELHASFRAERREAAWADGAERRIVGDLAALDVGTIAEKQVSCRRSICEVLFLVNRSSLPAAGNADERFNDALSGTVDGLAAGLGKKATFAITNGTDQPMIGVALYLHD